MVSILVDVKTFAFQCRYLCAIYYIQVVALMKIVNKIRFNFVLYEESVVMDWLPLLKTYNVNFLFLAIFQDS